MSSSRPKRISDTINYADMHHGRSAGSVLQSPLFKEAKNTLADHDHVADELDISIQQLSEEVDALSKEEERIRLILTIKEKKRNIDKMQQALVNDGKTSNSSSNSSRTFDHQKTSSDNDIQGTEHKSGKYMKIVDYIPKARNDEGEEYELGNGLKIKLKQSSKIKVEQVSPSQYIAASSKILTELIHSEWKNGNVDYQWILDYLTYQEKIGELGCRFTWASVMSYDDCYREQKETLRFKWGADNQHMSTLLLRERVSGNLPKKKENPAERGQAVCRNYNAQKGCSYTNCIFAHVCSICRSSHPCMDHPSA